MPIGNEDRALLFLGLCMRAGQPLTGQEACVTAIRGGQAALALMDEGASENTVKRITDACDSHGTPLYRISEGKLGHAIGKIGRMVVAVPPGNMAEKLLLLINETKPLEQAQNTMRDNAGVQGVQ